MSKTTLPPILDLNSSRQEILNYFKNGWNLTETLFSGLTKEEAFYLRPYHKLRHPMIFYYNHVATFYINKLRVAGLIEKPLNPDFEKLFEVGVDEMSFDDLHEGNQKIWPQLNEVKNYRQETYKIICNLIETHPIFEQLPITQKSPLWALFMAFEHEKIHLETSSVLIRQLPIDLVKKPENWPEFHDLNSNKILTNEMILVKENNINLGKSENFPTFGWDNEYGNEVREVKEFLAAKFLTSNREFFEFVKDGGYNKKEFWSKDGWNWRNFCNAKHPSFWVKNAPSGLHSYQLRSIFEIIEMQWNWPVCINFYEAKAYCDWLSLRDNKSYNLLTEAEHHAIRDNKITNYNLNLLSGAESSIDAFGANSKGFYDVFGNVWQWMEDNFHPLDGFKTHPYYDDFSTPCFDGKHQMILGGSFISSGDEASIWARFHFRPHFFQHAGFRVACSKNSPKLLSDSSYESTEMLNKYLLMHFGSDQEIWGNSTIKPAKEIVNLPLKCAKLLKEYAANFDLALDLGCAVGRSSFEMARDFKKVIGIDYSYEFIKSANKLKKFQEVTFQRKDSGDQITELVAKITPEIDCNRLHFEQGDACNLTKDLQDFDAVLMSNLLCRLQNPRSCLEHVKNIIKPNGILLMTTPFSWLTEYTPKSNWLNGIEDIKKILDNFDLIHQEELPFIIRDHQRRFEFIVTLATIWKKR